MMMLKFFLVTLVLFIVLLSINIFFKKRNSNLHIIIPLTGAFLGIILIGLSIFMKVDLFGMDIYAFALFASSAATFIISAIADNMSSLKKHYLSKK